MQIFMFLGFRAKAEILIPFIYWYCLFTSMTKELKARSYPLQHLPSFHRSKVKAYTHTGNSLVKNKETQDLHCLH